MMTRYFIKLAYLPAISKQKNTFNTKNMRHQIHHSVDYIIITVAYLLS